MADQRETVGEDVVEAIDIERDIRIAIWNAGMNGGMGQGLTQAFIRRAMDEPTMKRALDAITAAERRGEERMREKAAEEAAAWFPGASANVERYPVYGVVAAIRNLDTGGGV